MHHSAVHVIIGRNSWYKLEAVWLKPALLEIEVPNGLHVDGLDLYRIMRFVRSIGSVLCHFALPLISGLSIPGIEPRAITQMVG